MLDTKQTCFIIMPFSQTTDQHSEDYWTQHFQHFLKPLVDKHVSLVARRAEALRGDILRQIISDLVVSRIVLADLTDYNPNVFWELGVRQSFKHSTITIAEVGTDLPFDVGGKGTLFYHPKDHLKNADFGAQLDRALDDCLANPDRPDSHVLETLSGRGTLFEIFRREEALRRLDALLAECETNLAVFGVSEKLAAQNQADPKKRSYPTSRFQSAALILLVTNRYVDTDIKFFTLAQHCLRDIVNLDDQLKVWEHSPGMTESWLLENMPPKKQRLVILRDRVKALHDVIAGRL